MNLGDVFVSSTPCHDITVRLTCDGPNRWTRHCMANGCLEVYDIVLNDGRLIWTARRRRVA